MASTVALFLTTIKNLRDSEESKPKRQVNAFPKCHPRPATLIRTNEFKVSAWRCAKVVIYFDISIPNIENLSQYVRNWVNPFRLKGLPSKKIGSTHFTPRLDLICIKSVPTMTKITQEFWKLNYLQKTDMNYAPEKRIYDTSENGRRNLLETSVGGASIRLCFLTMCRSVARTI